MSNRPPIHVKPPTHSCQTARVRDRGYVWENPRVQELRPSVISARTHRSHWLGRQLWRALPVLVAREQVTEAFENGSMTLHVPDDLGEGDLVVDGRESVLETLSIDR